jgi:tetratricopeptide (TPR) repeat protein
MKRIRLSTILVLLAFVTAGGLSPACGAEGVILTIEVEEGIPDDDASFELIDQRKIELQNGEERASFQANFTLNATANLTGDGQVLLYLDLITLPPKPQTVFKEELAKDGSRFLFAEVKVKQDRIFRVYLIPKTSDIPEPSCDLNTLDKESEDWEELPSSHFFLRYILNSLADLHWSHIKGHAESEYKRFRETFGFTQPAMDRMEYFLLPCRANEVVWDDRFDIGLDPVKNKIYTVYNLFDRSLDSPGVGFLLFYRLWGYAPPMLAEGIGGYFSLSHHHTKKLIAAKKWVPLKQLMVTRDYRQHPKDVAFWESCSFVRFLVKTYRLDKFSRLYEKATDLTLQQVMEEVYEKNMSSLEEEWLSFLESHRDTILDFYYVTAMKMKNGHYDEAVELYHDMLDLFGRDPGTLRSLAYVHYLKGDYDESERYYQEVLSEDTLNLEYLHILGNIKTIKGEYDEAKSYYQRVIRLDSTYTPSYVKLANLEILNGDLLPAKERLERALELNPGSQTRVEIYSDLGTIYDKLAQSEQAKENFELALLYARRFVIEFSDRPIPYLKLGESFFNVGEVDSAINFLNIAEFLEDRPLYRSRTLLALGKAYQEKKNLAKAKALLQEALRMPAGYEERREAEKLLESM